MSDNRIVIAHAGGGDGDELAGAINRIVAEWNVDDVIDVDINPYVDRYGAADGEWYKAVVMMEVAK